MIIVVLRCLSLHSRFDFNRSQAAISRISWREKILEYSYASVFRVGRAMNFTLYEFSRIVRSVVWSHICKNITKQATIISILHATSDERQSTTTTSATVAAKAYIATESKAKREKITIFTMIFHSSSSRRIFARYFRSSTHTHSTRRPKMTNKLQFRIMSLHLNVNRMWFGRRKKKDVLE